MKKNNWYDFDFKHFHILPYPDMVSLALFFSFVAKIISIYEPLFFSSVRNVAWLYWDPDPVVFIIPYFDWPILWYGLFFAAGFFLGVPLFVSILSRYLETLSFLDPQRAKQEAVALADRLTLYIILATIIGARLGHFLFYEKPSEYLQDPLELLRTWEGGLASHGAVVAILLAVFLFTYKNRKRYPFIHWIRILDFMAIPACLVGALIRIGNFFNQEISGTPTLAPWGVIFGHPFDRAAPEPRHPVQLYEALAYLMIFFILWNLSKSSKWLTSRGRLLGLFLILVFSSRFFLEFFKTEQSRLISSEISITMGQILSLPMVGLGLLFLYFSFAFIERK